MTKPPLRPHLLEIDCKSAAEEISAHLRSLLAKELHRQGLVVGVSGGVDSSVTLALCVKAIGKERVIALLMPEKHSAGETRELSTKVANTYGVEFHYENISSILESVNFYRRYTQAVQTVIPHFDDTWKSKIVIPNALTSGGINYFSIVAHGPDGKKVKERLPLKAYLEIVAATNYKQRIRKMLEYYYADRFNYAVAGTPNRLEYDQGFFVKLGDGAADVKPIAHLYKTQVYALAKYLGVPHEICTRAPTTDTYSLAQGQDEFYFALPYEQMDMCLYGKNNGYSCEDVAAALQMPQDVIRKVYKDIDRKRSTTRYLQLPPLLVGDVPEITH
ncbi:MAG: NAD(+) synthase [Chitinivibrionales bacterium]|nr:NAD(+) synthase [Chitinivibrionales bacterium]